MTKEQYDNTTADEPAEVYETKVTKEDSLADELGITEETIKNNEAGMSDAEIEALTGQKANKQLPPREAVKHKPIARKIVKPITKAIKKVTE